MNDGSTPFDIKWDADGSVQRAAEIALNKSLHDALLQSETAANCSFQLFPLLERGSTRYWRARGLRRGAVTPFANGRCDSLGKPTIAPHPADRPMTSTVPPSADNAAEPFRVLQHAQIWRV